MTDIVERLRQWAECDVRETGRDGTFEQNDAEKWASMMEEAADEIERLRSLTEWRTIETKRETDMAVMFYFANRRWLDRAGNETSYGPVRDHAESCEIGYYQDGGWFEAGTGHDVFEDWHGDDVPTHWLPLPPPPQEKDTA